MAEKIRIKDIAERAGVSVGTVDRVLHKRPNVSEAALKRVEKVLKEMNYQPNVYASALAYNKSYTFYCLIPKHSSEAYWEEIEIGAMKAVEARSEGKSLAETLDILLALRPKVQTYFLVDDLNHLVRGGRISKTAAMIGSLASIKPIIAVQADGSLKPIAKVRGKKKAQAECVRMLLENIADDRAVIAHADADQDAENLKEQLLADGRVKEVLIEPLGPVIATHVGPGTLALFGFAKNDRD